MSEQGEYTPSVAQVKEDWISFMITPGDYWDAVDETEAEARWDRMIAQVRREAAAEQREKDIAAIVARNGHYGARNFEDDNYASGAGDALDDAAAAIREQ